MPEPRGWMPKKILVEIPLADLIYDRRSFLEALDSRTGKVRASYLANLDRMPPIRVRKQGEKWWIVDGHHRLAATQELGREKIRAMYIE